MTYHRSRTNKTRERNENHISLDSLDYNSMSDSDAMFKYILRKDEKNIEKESASNFNYEDQKNFQENKKIKNRKSFPDYGEVIIDSYRPLQIRGQGSGREGMCPHCRCFFKLKTSNYWYHLNYTHGINPKGMPYPDAKCESDSNGYYAICPVCNTDIRLGKKPNSTFMAPYFKHFYKNHKKSM